MVSKFLLLLTQLIDPSLQYFTRISQENKEKIEESFRALYEDCDQQQSGVARIDSAVAGLRKLLNMIEKDLKNYMDEAVEKTIEKMSDDKDSLYMQTMNVGLWHMMADFLPQSMNWFVKLVRKLLTSIVEDKPVDTVIVCRFLSSFSRDFRLPLKAIINPTLNYTLLLETV